MTLVRHRRIAVVSAGLAVGAALGVPGVALAQTGGTSAGAPSVAAPSAAGPDTLWRAVITGPPSLIRRISGVRAEPGPFREYFQSPPASGTGAHRHTADMHIRVISGRQYILMGDLDSARVQHFDAGQSFVIPAGMWHVEWFEEDTLVEISGVGPMRTERPPAAVRVPVGATVPHR